MTDREKLEALRAWLIERRDHNQGWADRSRTVLGRMMEADLVREDNAILSKINSLLAEPSERGKSQPEHKWIACGGCARIVPANHICEGKD